MENPLKNIDVFLMTPEEMDHWLENNLQSLGQNDMNAFATLMFMAGQAKIYITKKNMIDDFYEFLEKEIRKVEKVGVH